MPLYLDHAVIAVHNLETAIEDYRDLGYTVISGGIHANRATRNALIVFEDATYLELLALAGEPPLPGLIDFSVLLQNSEGLVGFALRTDDIEADVARLKAHGYPVSDVLPGERRRDDGTVIQWKLALVEGGFAPFLIQDVTPRSWRIPDDPAATTHRNRAVGIRAVEIIARNKKIPWKRFTEGLGLPVIKGPGSVPTIEGIRLYERKPGDLALLEYPDELPDQRRMFGGIVSQAEIDAADPALEPRSFAIELEVKAEMLERERDGYVQHLATCAVIADREEGLFAIHLIWEQDGPYYFTSEKTHGVHFRQLPGTSSTRGAHILTGLNDIDWSAVTHAYGAATDTPELLRAVASDSTAIREYGYQGMFNRIVHQGSVFRASIEVIPFLMQLLNAPEIEEQDRLLRLLHVIVSGGIVLPELRERTQVMLRQALPVLLAHLHDTDIIIRRMIADQLHVYFSEVTRLEPVLRSLIDSDNDASVRAASMETLARLWTGSTDIRHESARLTPEHSAYIAELMRDSAQPPAVRFMAARVLLLKDDADEWLDEATQVFYRVMENEKSVLDSLSVYPRNWLGGIFYRVIEALSGHREKALDWTLTQANHPEAEIRAYVPYQLESFARYPRQPFEPMLPVLMRLLDDPSPEVRQSAVGFFSRITWISGITERLKAIMENDLSLTVRIVARNTLEIMAERQQKTE